MSCFEIGDVISAEKWAYIGVIIDVSYIRVGNLRPPAEVYDVLLIRKTTFDDVIIERLLCEMIDNSAKPFTEPAGLEKINREYLKFKMSEIIEA